MGPSILAAAFTTFAAAITMLFCQITFFNKFALILLMTILHATIASFVIYIVLTDCFGPSEPTKCFDGIFMKIKGLCSKDDEPKYSASPEMIDGKLTYDLGKTFKASNETPHYNASPEMIDGKLTYDLGKLDDGKPPLSGKVDGGKQDSDHAASKQGSDRAGEDIILEQKDDVSSVTNVTNLDFYRNSLTNEVKIDAQHKRDSLSALSDNFEGNP